MRPLTGLLLVVSVVMAQSHFHRRRNTDEILDCSRLVDGNYPNPSERCSHVFVTCDNGQVLTRNCPGTTFYDELIDDCAEKEFVRACGGQLPRVEENKQTPVQEAAHRPVQEAPQPPPAVVTDRPLRKEIVEGSTVEHILFNCAGLRPGNHPNPAAKDGCSPIFFSCGAARRPHLMMCPGRTYYDDEINACNYFSDVPKCSGVPRTTTTVGEPGSTTTVAPDPYDCKRLPDGNYAPPKEETTCPGYFYQCANRRGFRVNCPLNTLRYDINQDACVAASEVPGCANEPN